MPVVVPEVVEVESSRVDEAEVVEVSSVTIVPDWEVMLTVEPFVPMLNTPLEVRVNPGSV